MKKCIFFSPNFDTCYIHTIPVASRAAEKLYENVKNADKASQQTIKPNKTNSSLKRLSHFQPRKTVLGKKNQPNEKMQSKILPHTIFFY